MKISLSSILLFILVSCSNGKKNQIKYNYTDQNNLKQGEWIYYGEDSIIIKKGTYVNDLPVDTWYFYDLGECVYTEKYEFGGNIVNYSSKTVTTTFLNKGDTVYQVIDGNGTSKMKVFNDTLYLTNVKKSTKYLSNSFDKWEQGYKLISSNCLNCHTVKSEDTSILSLYKKSPQLFSKSALTDTSLNIEHSDLLFLTEGDVECIIQYLKDPDKAIQ